MARLFLIVALSLVALAILGRYLPGDAGRERASIPPNPPPVENEYFKCPALYLGEEATIGFLCTEPDGSLKLYGVQPLYPTNKKGPG